MNRVALVSGMILVLGTAIVHGAVTQRWSMFEPDRSGTEQVHGSIVRFGDFESSEVPHDVPLKERSIATSRKYVSDSQGVIMMTSIISGVPGAVSTHTPDICYTSSGYTMVRGPKKETYDLPGGGKAECYVADFEKRRATDQERLRIRWCWSDNGQWGAPDRPRFAYIKNQELFKLYLVCQIPDNELGEDSPTVRGFVTAAMAQYGEAIARR